MRFNDKKFLAIQIKNHRKKKGLTQAELAEKTDLSTQHISRIESACYTPSLKSFFLLVEVLDIDLRIFGFNIERTNNVIKEELINEISKATDAELILYKNIINSVRDSLDTIKTNLL